MPTPVTFAVLGCGDVAFRTYLPALQALAAAGRARVAACADPRPEQAARAAALFPGARAVPTLDDLLAVPGLDALVNLTPAPLHRATTAAALAAGLHVWSEKPIAATLAEAQELTDLAAQADRLLLVAPAVMATPRFRWLKRTYAAGHLGRPTLAVAQMANMGPADWRDYTGDPAVFYGPAVGPLLDTGVYVLHAVTGLLGPARRVQALGGIAIPRRDVLIPRLAGQTIEVAANDQMLLHLDFGDNVFAQVLSSFAVPASDAPALEVHATGGSLSLTLDRWYDGGGPLDLYLREDGPLGPAGWRRDVAPPDPGPEGPLRNTIVAGLPHLIACLAGEEPPILTAAHATHTLEIILTATQSAATGRALDLETTF